MKETLRECQTDAAPVHPTKGELWARRSCLTVVWSLICLYFRRREELYFDRGPQQGAKRAVQVEEVEVRRRLHRAALQASGLGGCQNDLLSPGCRKGDLPSGCRILSLRRLNRGRVQSSSVPNCSGSMCSQARNKTVYGE